MTQKHTTEVLIFIFFLKCPLCDRFSFCQNSLVLNSKAGLVLLEQAKGESESYREQEVKQLGGAFIQAWKSVQELSKSMS